jgi:predicted thioredoxin/glutaredoxin
MAKPSNIDQLEAALRAGQPTAQSAAEDQAQAQKIDTWISENPDRYIAMQEASQKMTRAMVVQAMQTQGDLAEIVEAIRQRLAGNPELREKVAEKIRDKQDELLTQERKNRIFRVFGIHFEQSHETIRQRPS